MSLTARRRRPLDRTIHHLRDTRFVVVATEGERTEEQYFSFFERKGSRVRVVVLGTTNGKSSPRHVLARLVHWSQKLQLTKDDALCLVVDEDRWPKAQLREVAKEAVRRRYELAISCPCFEVWLYLHLADPPGSMAAMNSRQVQEELRRVLGNYDRVNLKMEPFAQHVGDAVRRAQGLDCYQKERWPRRPGTRVYRVIEHIQELS